MKQAADESSTYLDAMFAVLERQEVDAVVVDEAAEADRRGRRPRVGRLRRGAQVPPVAGARLPPRLPSPLRSPTPLDLVADSVRKMLGGRHLRPGRRRDRPLRRGPDVARAPLREDALRQRAAALHPRPAAAARARSLCGARRARHLRVPPPRPAPRQRPLRFLPLGRHRRRGRAHLHVDVGAGRRGTHRRRARPRAARPRPHPRRQLGGHERPDPPRRPRDEPEAVDAVLAKLLEARSKRPQPDRDDKALVSWNGLLAAASSRPAPLRRRRDAGTKVSSCCERLLDERARRGGRGHPPRRGRCLRRRAAP